MFIYAFCQRHFSPKMVDLYKTRHCQSLVWVDASYGFVPNDAIVAGHDSTGRAVYAARAVHDGKTILGELVESNEVCHLAYLQKKVKSFYYQILTNPSGKTQICWKGAAFGNVLPGAVLGGQGDEDQPTYVGCWRTEGSTVCGKVDPYYKGMFYVFAGKVEYSIPYEILVVKLNK